MLKHDELPCLPENDRIVVLPAQPASETEGKLVIPEIAQKQAHEGRILAAGLKALDILYDHGGQIGDTILYGQFAGAWEEWDHIVKDGSNPDCQHGDWNYEPSLNGFRRHGHKCSDCGALRLHEPILIMNVGDILANVSKAARVRSGEMIVSRGSKLDGASLHYVVRPGEIQSTETTNGAVHVA